LKSGAKGADTPPGSPFRTLSIAAWIVRTVIVVSNVTRTLPVQVLALA
jgi:hypothetical protein